MLKQEIERAPSVLMSRSARLVLAVVAAFVAWFVQIAVVEGLYPVRLARESVRISRIYHDAVVADVKATLRSRQSIGIDDASGIIDTFLTNNIALIREESCSALVPCPPVRSHSPEYYQWIADNTRQINACLGVVRPIVNDRRNGLVDAVALDRTLRDSQNEFATICPSFRHPLGLRIETEPLSGVDDPAGVMRTRAERLTEAVYVWDLFNAALPNELLSTGSANPASGRAQANVLTRLDEANRLGREAGLSGDKAQRLQDIASSIKLDVRLLAGLCEQSGHDERWLKVFWAIIVASALFAYLHPVMPEILHTLVTTLARLVSLIVAGLTQ
jgi:hypothetical protein